MLDKLTQAKVVIRYGGELFELAVAERQDDGKFEVIWTDYVINVDTEVFDTLSVALMRAAALIKCGEDAAMFRQSPEEFSVLAKDFLEQAVDKS